jgi:FxLD family lantipeptide
LAIERKARIPALAVTAAWAGVPRLRSGRRRVPAVFSKGVTVSASITSAPAAAMPGTGLPAGDGFDLDVRIVEAGPAAAMLLGITDDGCNTVAGSDC